MLIKTALSDDVPRAPMLHEQGLAGHIERTSGQSGPKHLLSVVMHYNRTMW